MYVVVETEPGVFTTGFYAPSSQWHSDQDFASSEEAIARMRFLNGAPDPTPPKKAKQAAKAPEAPKK